MQVTAPVPLLKRTRLEKAILAPTSMLKSKMACLDQMLADTSNVLTIPLDKRLVAPDHKAFDPNGYHEWVIKAEVNVWCDNGMSMQVNAMFGPTLSTTIRDDGTDENHYGGSYRRALMWHPNFRLMTLRQVHRMIHQEEIKDLDNVALFVTPNEVQDKLPNGGDPHYTFIMRVKTAQDYYETEKDVSEVLETAFTTWVHICRDRIMQEGKMDDTACRI